MGTEIETYKTIGSLKKRADFLRLQQGGEKWVTKNFILRRDQRTPASGDSPDPHPDIRFGLTVTKRMFKNATDRNRVKRRLRSAIQNILPISDHKTKMDYVFIGRKEALTCDYNDLEKDLKWALKRLSKL